MLNNFLKEYGLSVQTYLQVQSNEQYGRLFTKLLRLFLEDETHKHLTKIFIDFNWHAAGTGTILSSKEALPQDMDQKFENDVQKIAAKLSNRSPKFGRKKTKYVGKSGKTFLFDRQVGDELLQTINGPKRFKPSRYLLVKLGADTIEVRERRRLNYTAPRVERLVEKLFNVALQNTSELPSQVNSEKFKMRFTTQPENDNRISIISLKLRRSTLTKAVPIALDNYQEGSDIVNAIKDLLEKEDVAELVEPTDVGEFAISFHYGNKAGRRKRIRVNEKTDGSVSLEMDSKDMSDSERDEFYKAFEEQFGLRLNVSLDPTNLTANKEHTLNFILSEGKVDSSRAFLATQTTRLKQLGIIKTKGKFKLKCTPLREDKLQCR